MSSPVDLSKLTVAVTGAARGIGLATVQAFAAAGARVVAGDLDELVLADAVRGPGGRVESLALDVTSRPSFAAFLAAPEDGFETWVPASIGRLYHLTALLPRPARDALTRTLGIERTLTDIDWSARAAYEQRAAVQPSHSLARPRVS